MSVQKPTIRKSSSYNLKDHHLLYEIFFVDFMKVFDIIFLGGRTNIMEFLIFFVVIIVVFVYMSWQNQEIQNRANVKSTTVMKDPKFKDAKKIVTLTNDFILISEVGDIYLYIVDRFFSIKDLNSYKIDIDGIEQGGIGRAVAGGLLFGGAGAIVGSITANKSKIRKISVIFNLNDFKAPTAELTVLNLEIKEGSELHNRAKDILNNLFATLELVEKNTKKYKKSLKK